MAPKEQNIYWAVSLEKLEACSHLEMGYICFYCLLRNCLLAKLLAHTEQIRKWPPSTFYEEPERKVYCSRLRSFKALEAASGWSKNGSLMFSRVIYNFSPSHVGLKPDRTIDVYVTFFKGLNVNKLDSTWYNVICVSMEKHYLKLVNLLVKITTMPNWHQVDWPGEYASPRAQTKKKVFLGLRSYRGQWDTILWFKVDHIRNILWNRITWSLSERWSTAESIFTLQIQLCQVDFLFFYGGSNSYTFAQFDFW